MLVEVVGVWARRRVTDVEVPEPDELTNRRPCALPLRRECLAELLDGRAVVLPPTGVVESRGVECDGEVVRRTLLTYRCRKWPCHVAAFSCRTGRCWSSVVTPAAGRRLPCSSLRRHPSDAVGRATIAIPFPWPGLTDGRPCWSRVVNGRRFQSKCPSPGSRTFTFFPFTAFFFFWAILLPLNYYILRTFLVCCVLTRDIFLALVGLITLFA